jgi:hypothetical protein
MAVSGGMHYLKTLRPVENNQAFHQGPAEALSKFSFSALQISTPPSLSPT